MREHLRAAGVEFDDRNVRQDPAARAELEAITGSVVVPVLVHGDRSVSGYDPAAIDALLRDDDHVEAAAADQPRAPRAPSPSAGHRPPGDALEREQVGRITAPGGALRDALESLVARTQEEYAYSVAKGDGPYHAGMRDGLRYALDALQDLLHSHPDEDG